MPALADDDSDDDDDGADLLLSVMAFVALPVVCPTVCPAAASVLPGGLDVYTVLSEFVSRVSVCNWKGSKPKGCGWLWYVWLCFFWRGDEGGENGGDCGGEEGVVLRMTAVPLDACAEILLPLPLPGPAPALYKLLPAPSLLTLPLTASGDQWLLALEIHSHRPT
jgi:hypothetical protein